MISCVDVVILTFTYANNLFAVSEQKFSFNVMMNYIVSY